MLLLFLLLTPKPAAAGTTFRYDTLHATVRSTTVLIPEIRNANRTDQDQMLCLALNIYHEIRGGTPRDQWAVGFVTLNRTKHSAFKAKSVCQAVWAQGQFSWTRWSMRAQLPREQAAWAECQRKAHMLFAGEKMNDPTNGSTHFYQARLNPGWALRLVSKVRIGSHTFARLPGG